MRATPQQLATLDRFVADQTVAGWSVLERASHHFASLTAPVTDAYAWYIQLDPGVPDDDPYPHARWRASCQRGEHAQADTFAGSLDACSDWIRSRVTEWQRARQAARDVRDFAAGRPAWNFYDRERGHHYAGRHFRYAGGDRVLLSVSPFFAERRRDRFRAELTLQFAAGAECAHVTNRIEQAAEWIDNWERTLCVPLDLSACTTPEEADGILNKADNARLYGLSYAFDIPGGLGAIRRTLVERFAPDVAGRS